MSLTLKITSLFVRTLAKPLANTIKRNAHEHERFRKLCVKFAQGLHRIDMRMRLGLLQDPAVIDKQIAKEVAAAEAARKKAQIPTVKTEAETKAEAAMTEKERDAAKKKVEAAHKPKIRPLSEAKAIETGANFVSETFIFAVGIGVILVEQWRQRRKAKNQRDDIKEDLEDLQKELTSVRTELEELRAKQSSNSASGKLIGFWKGKPEAEKTDSEKPSEEQVQALDIDTSLRRTLSTDAWHTDNCRARTAQSRQIYSGRDVFHGLGSQANQRSTSCPSYELQHFQIEDSSFLDFYPANYAVDPFHYTMPPDIARTNGPANQRSSMNPVVPSRPSARSPRKTTTATKPVAPSAHRPPANAVTDLLPWCTTQMRLSNEQVIALSDVAGSLKELMLLALRTAEDGVARYELERAIGVEAAAGIIDFWSEEFVTGM